MISLIPVFILFFYIISFFLESISESSRSKTFDQIHSSFDADEKIIFYSEKKRSKFALQLSLGLSTWFLFLTFYVDISKSLPSFMFYFCLLIYLAAFLDYLDTYYSQVFITSKRVIHRTIFRPFGLRMLALSQIKDIDVTYLKDRAILSIKGNKGFRITLANFQDYFQIKAILEKMAFSKEELEEIKKKREDNDLFFLQILAFTFLSLPLIIGAIYIFLRR